jgi:hypothetical protein
MLPVARDENGAARSLTTHLRQPRSDGAMWLRLALLSTVDPRIISADRQRLAGSDGSRGFSVGRAPVAATIRGDE